MDTASNPQDFRAAQEDLPVWRDELFMRCAPDGVVHGFFTRQGGVSDGLYAGLNCGPGSNDDPEAVKENRSRVADALGVEHLLSLYQVHGNTCLYVDKPWSAEERPQADAFVTDRPGLGLGVLTADCGPVLFYGSKENGDPIVGAAHAGWQGALSGVLESTVEAMKTQGADTNTIRASIGPCIQKRSYEVGMEFFEAFLRQNSAYEIFFMDGNNLKNKYFDLSGFCAYRLAQIGVKNVAVCDHDTYKMQERYFSYRRTTHENEPDYGRQISVIAIKS